MTCGTPSASSSLMAGQMARMPAPDPARGTAAGSSPPRLTPAAAGTPPSMEQVNHELSAIEDEFGLGADTCLMT